MTVRQSFDLKAFFVNRAVMSSTQHREIRQLRRAAVRPMSDVMTLAERPATAGETAIFVAMVKPAPQRRWDRSRARAYLGDAALSVMPHHDTAGVAGQPLGRSGGNAGAAFEHRLARSVAIGQYLGLDVNDDLVPLARRAGIDAMMQRRLGHQRQGVGLLLLHGRRLRRAVDDGRSS